MVHCSTPSLISSSAYLLIVFKRTGGRQWLKPWGFTGLSQHQKARKRRQKRRADANRAVLSEAETSHWEHITETGQLPHWGVSNEQIRQAKLDTKRRWLLWRATESKYLPGIAYLQQIIDREATRFAHP
jgi:hypothetical protein